MSGFKLLAIRPLEGCDSRFRKNLKEGEIYQFYQDFDFIIDLKGEKKSTSDLEQQTGNLVYKLTYDEVLVVEPEFAERMSREEYEKLTVE